VYHNRYDFSYIDGLGRTKDLKRAIRTNIIGLIFSFVFYVAFFTCMIIFIPSERLGLRIVFIFVMSVIGVSGDCSIYIVYQSNTTRL